ncbi:putative hydrolase [Planctomycetes bacterium Pan216]|uniref:Putative hydrolase n=1 Tax=Kolteria novifilia TaxID=2527975 RepID=A0A518B989_9BACT|nr:putative hydrolase [Planctomycetes bacterium Pan216]
MLERAPTIFEEGVYHRRLEEENDRRPVALFLPQAYEPRYPYPLVVFLHGHGETETQWTNSIASLSRRNYIGISLRGPHAVNRQDGRRGYSWGRHRRSDGLIEDYVLAAIRQTMQSYNIHSERIFLAGFCEGATVAYRLGVMFPEKFAGMVALNGWLPSGRLPLGRVRAAGNPRVFIGHAQENAHVPVQHAADAYRLLYTAGLDVTLRTYGAGHRLQPSMLRDVDHWLIESCHSSTL